MRLEKREKPVIIGWGWRWETDGLRGENGQVYFRKTYQVWKWELSLWRKPVSDWAKFR